MKVWLNGTVLESADARVSVHDHGLTVGDGVFETLKVIDGIPFALTRHLNRLRTSAASLGLTVPPDDQLRGGVASLLAAHERAEVGRLRITLTGGDGPPGTERGTRGPTVLMVVGPPGTWPESTALCVVPWPRKRAGLKADAIHHGLPQPVPKPCRPARQGIDWPRC